MARFPRKGGLYWLATDIWENFIAVPVIVARRRRAKAGLRIKARLAGLGAREKTDFAYCVPRSALHRTYRRARAEASRLNEGRRPDEAAQGPVPENI